MPIVIHKNKHVRSIGIICKNNKHLDYITEVKILFAMTTQFLKYLGKYLTINRQKSQWICEVKLEYTLKVHMKEINKWKRYYILGQDILYLKDFIFSF